MRLNPRDCLSAIDVVQQAGIRVEGMSFAQLTSLAFSSLLEMCRQQKIIPTRDGFEYEQMMTSFPPDAGHARKLAIAKTIDSVGSDVQVPPPMTSAPRTAEEARLNRRWRELAQRKELDPENWTEQDQVEMHELFTKLFPV